MNNWQFNQDQFNQDHIYAEVATYPVAFNGYNLMSLCSDSVWVIIQSMNAYDVTWIDVTAFSSALADGWSVINKKYWNKSISMTLFLQGSSHNDLIARLDELKQKTQGIEANFDITVWDGIRRYAATVTGFQVPAFKKTDDHIQWIEVEMLITSPFWTKTAMSQTYAQGMTADFSKVVQNNGTYKAYPIVELITNAWSTLSAVSIEMKKIWETSGYTIGITTAIPPSSVVIFDFIEKKVTVNDVEVNFTGVMMPMQVWQSVFTFDMTWTIDVNVYILHYPTFL